MRYRPAGPERVYADCDGPVIDLDAIDWDERLTCDTPVCRPRSGQLGVRFLVAAGLAEYAWPTELWWATVAAEEKPRSPHGGSLGGDRGTHTTHDSTAAPPWGLRAATTV